MVLPCLPQAAKKLRAFLGLGEYRSLVKEQEMGERRCVVVVVLVLPPQQTIYQSNDRANIHHTPLIYRERNKPPL